MGDEEGAVSLCSPSHPTLSQGCVPIICQTPTMSYLRMSKLVSHTYPRSAEQVAGTSGSRMSSLTCLVGWLVAGVSGTGSHVTCHSTS